MSTARQAVRPLARCVHNAVTSRKVASTRAFSATSRALEEVHIEETSTPPSPPPSGLDPNLVSTRREERKLLKDQKVLPVGSRRRRAALHGSANIPFEQLPYQCFQEARKILQADRKEKIEQIQVQRSKIARLQAQEPYSGGALEKERRLKSMQKHLEDLKILADINDPMIKKRFEDGDGDMGRPIYRYLADRRWRSYKRLILMQRIEQMNVIPDILPNMDPIAEVNLSFGRRNVQPGEFVDSRVSELPGTLNVQVFDKGSRPVTVAIVDADVPDVENDRFNYRCHFLAANIWIAPKQTKIHLNIRQKDKILLPWLPAYAQKGSPYHRLGIFILEQPEGKTIDVAEAMKERFYKDGTSWKVQRDKFVLRSFIDRHSLKPVGVTMFRTQWDEGTAGVMQRAGIAGADVELRRKRIEPLPYKKKDGARYR